MLRQKVEQIARELTFIQQNREFSYFSWSEAETESERSGSGRRSELPISVLHRQRSSEVELFTELDIQKSKRTKKGAKVINRERKRYSARSDVTKIFTLHEPITDSTMVLKTCYRQPKYIITVWQTLSFQSREFLICILQSFRRGIVWYLLHPILSRLREPG